MIVTNYPKDVTLKVNNFCRDLKIKFFAGDIFGYFGYSFMDLVKHDYVEEEVKKVEAGEGKKAKEDEPDAKKAKMVRFLDDFRQFYHVKLTPCPFTSSKMFCAGPNILSQPKNLTAISASSKTFVLAQKSILRNANHLFVWHNFFVTATICK